MPKMKYIGKAWTRGVPMRDLSAEEVEKYGGVELLESTGLYKAVEEKPPVKKPVYKKGIEESEVKVDDSRS